MKLKQVLEEVFGNVLKKVPMEVEPEKTLKDVQLEEVLEEALEEVLVLKKVTEEVLIAFGKV